MTHHLVGVAEIAEMMGVSRQRVNAIVRTHDDFPAAAAVLAAGRIWERADVEEWIERRRKPGLGG